MSSPVLSVIVPSPRGLPGAQLTLAALAGQRIADQLEVLVVQPPEAPGFEASELLSSFAALRTIAVTAGQPVWYAYAAGVRAARARYVALGEDHSFPQPGWAEALVAALARGAAVVGPAVRNANPVNGVSWADFWIGYGPWAEPVRGGVVELLPGHNSAYRRDVLMALDDGLENALAAEAVLHWQLRDQGQTLWLEPGAVTAHMNFGVLRVFARVQPLTGRVFAAARSANWGAARRLAWAAAFPAIAAVRTLRTFRLVRRRRTGAPGSAAFFVLFGLVLDAAGQAMGYLFGAGAAPQRLREYEHARERFAGLPADG